jgi:dihydrofolate synthase/folylpolyglutamate synthase
LADEILRGNAFGGRRPVVALWSMLGDKDVGGFVRAMAPAVDAWVAYPLAHERAAPVGTLLRAAGRSGARAVGSAPDFLTAWRDARAIAGSGGAVIVCGSLVAVADAYSERVGHI